MLKGIMLAISLFVVKKENNCFSVDTPSSVFFSCIAFYIKMIEGRKSTCWLFRVGTNPEFP